MAKAFPRKHILESLFTVLSDIASTYTSNRPQATDSQLKEFIVVDIPGTMLDENAYQSASLRIDMFRRDNKEYEDVTGLEALYLKVINLFPITTDTYRIISPRLVAGGSDGKGFHYLMIYAKILTN